jgi:hypothetical protein
MKHTVREELHGILAFIGLIWAVFLVDAVIPDEFASFGLVPRTLRGLIGIPAMPFLHANHSFSSPHRPLRMETLRC